MSLQFTPEEAQAKAGATEHQDISAAKSFSCYGDDKVQAYEVEPIQKTITVYEAVK